VTLVLFSWAAGSVEATTSTDEPTVRGCTETNRFGQQFSRAAKTVVEYRTTMSRSVNNAANSTAMAWMLRDF
jgi:hypothetical protein